MNKSTFKTLNRLAVIIVLACSLFSFSTDKAQSFSVQISDKPLTFCNPITLDFGTGRARRAGEPVVVLHQDDYYLFITGLRGYWYSGNMRDWTYVDAPDLPGGCPSVASDGKRLIVSGDKTRRDVLGQYRSQERCLEKSRLL